MKSILRITLFLSIFFNSQVFSHDRIVFLHIPKCGGTSIYYMFKNNFDDSKIYPFRKLAKNIVYDESVLSIFPDINEYAVAGHFPFWFLKSKDYNFDSTFIFTVLRDPVERIISQHRDFLRGGLGQEFSCCPYCCNMMCRMLCSRSDLEGEELIQDCIQNLKRINFIILMDNYNKDIEKLFSILNLKLPDNDIKWWRWLNKTQGTEFDIYIDEETKQKIRERNSLDIQLYEYVKYHLKDNRIVD